MRLFVAIDVTAAARDALVAEQRRLATLWRTGRAPKFVKPAQLHLTLVFIGPFDDTAVPRFVECLAAPLSQARFDIEIGGIGVFPPHGAPRILWAGVENGAPRVKDVHDDVAARLEMLGVPREPRPFHPHLTLGRWRDSRPSDRAPVQSLEPNILASVPVTAVALYRSTLSSAGSTYTQLTRGELR